MTHYHAYYNTAGYMPNNDEPLYPFDSFEDAKRDLIHTLLRIEDMESVDPIAQALSDAAKEVCRAGSA